MTNAGWYPDPAGQPNTYRYWNGHSWSEETTTRPPSPAPGPPAYPAYGQPAAPPHQQAPPTQAVPPAYGAAPPGQPGGYGQPAGYGQPGYGAAPPGYGYGAPGAPGGSGGSGRTILVIALACVLVIALGVGAFLVVRALGDDDDATAGDDSSQAPSPSPTDEPTDEPTDDGATAQPTEAQCTGGRPDPGRLPKNARTLTGGGLTMPSLVEDGYTPEARLSPAFTWADAFQMSYKEVPDAGSWISNYGVGGLNRANGFESPQQAAEVIVGCLTASEAVYAGFTGATEVEAGPVTVDGHEAYSILTEIRVENPDVQAEGDLTQVVVVDTGDPASYGLYISAVTIGDQPSIDQQAEVFEQIRVD